MILFYFLILFMAVVRQPLLSELLGEDTMFKYLGAVCVIYAIFHMVRQGTVPRFIRTWQMRFFLIFYAICLASYLAKGLSYQPILSMTSMLLLLFVTVTVVDSEKRLRGTMIAVIASLTFASMYVIREWQVYHAIYEGMRASGITGDSNYFSASALISLPIAYYMMAGEERKWIRLASFGALLIILLATMFAASRGGMIGLGFVALHIAFHSKKRVPALLLMVVGLGGFLLFTPNSPLDRFLHPAYGDELAIEARKYAWTAGERMIQAHPLSGVGIGNFKTMMPAYSDVSVSFSEIAHNSYIEITAEMGIPALLIFLLMVATAYLSLQSVRRKSLDLGQGLIYRAAAALQAALVGFGVAAFVLSAEYQKLFWLAMGLSMVLPILVEQAEAVAQEQGDNELEPQVAGVEFS